MEVTNRTFSGRIVDGFGQAAADLVISATSLQAMSANTAYWIDRNGGLWTTGGAISALNPTNQPSSLGGVNGVVDLSALSNAQWSLFYGAQGGSAGGRIGLAEVWPTTPLPAAEVGTIAPYVRDATSHYLAPAGLTQNIVRTIPGAIDAIWDITYGANLGATLGPFDMEDFEELIVNFQFSTGITACSVTPYEVAADGTALQFGPAQVITAATTYAVMTWGPMSNFGSGGLTAIQGMLPWRTQLTFTAPGSGVTTRARITGKRRLPLRRMGKVCPYIQFTTVPTAATPIYMSIWGA
jgi:hypothetical protein